MKAISFDDIEDLQSKIAELEKERDAANKRAAQAEADARALAERVFDTELFGDKEAEIMFRYLPREQMNGAGYKNEETI